MGRDARISDQKFHLKSCGEPRVLCKKLRDSHSEFRKTSNVRTRRGASSGFHPVVVEKQGRVQFTSRRFEESLVNRESLARKRCRQDTADPLALTLAGARASGFWIL